MLVGMLTCSVRLHKKRQPRTLAKQILIKSDAEYLAQ